MTSFLDYIQDHPVGRIKAYVYIDGIKYAFVQDRDAPQTARTERVLLDSIELGESRLDIVARRQYGSSMTVTIVDDADGTNEGTMALLMKPRARRSSWVTAPATRGATSIDVYTPANLTSPVFINGETITFTGTAGSQITGCTRGAYGSRPQRHAGGTDQGASVYESPPSWKGRRLQVYLYAVGPDGISESWQMGAYRIEESPYSDGSGRWVIPCSEVIDDLANRKVGHGLEWMQNVDRIEGDRVHYSDNSTERYFVTGTEPHQLLVRFSGGSRGFEDSYLCRNVLSVSTGSNYIDLANDTKIAPRPRAPEKEDAKIESKVIFFGLQPGVTNLLRLLASRVGDGDNGTYDVLPGGSIQNLAERRWRLGADIDENEIDIATFEALRHHGPAWPIVVDREISVQDLLFDFCLVYDLFWFCTRTGAITVSPSEERIEQSSSRTLTGLSDIVTEPKVYLDETVYPTAEIKINWNPLTDEHESEIVIRDAEITDRFPYADEPLQIQSYTLAVQELRKPGHHFRAQTHSRPDIESRLRTMMKQNARGNCIVEFWTVIDHVDLYIGDVVTLDFSYWGTTDLAGNAITNSRAIIVGYQPDLQRGRVKLRCQIQETPLVIAPAARISSVGGGGTIINFLTTGYEPTDTTPGQMFKIGWWVYIWYDNGLSDYIDIVGLAGTSITIGAALTYPGGGNPVFVTTGDNGDPGVGGTSGDGFAQTDFLFMQPEYADTNAPGALTVTRWR